ncbi:carbohydrate ABC transporter permease [Streptomyces sp. WAC 00631]|uniref:carbohydrate ABC transporter permease n=1 Tax=unclassified Streptomyces TaxID=2593676 RepID=UPI000F7AD0F9|nr:MULTISPECIES: carbohydrate ABC transporter permease [unclassified Streptomyces]MCC5033320.1 carbohydrate ABC transporter permease [Streptomyces sp. WAC 00631]MCC9741410.1 carbohydrate ABC transporter permease [Streptomyces sp. MNU89]
MSLLTDTAGAHAPRPAAAAGPRGPRDSRLSVIAATGFLALIAVYMLLPVFWLVVSATKSQGDLVDSFGLWFSDFHLADNLSALFAKQDGVYLPWLLNSLLYAGAGAAVGTLLSAMAGYALAKYRFRGRELLFSVVLGGVLVPATALALPLFLLFAEVGATNTFWSVFLPSVVSPFGVYLSRIFAAASVPDELLEAARIDGSGELRTFFTLALRLMSPAMVTIFLFQFVVVWNNFLLPLVMLQDDRLYPVTLGLFTWQSQVSRDPSLQILSLTGSLVSVVPIVITFLVLQRYWKAGLAAGAVKA